MLVSNIRWGFLCFLSQFRHYIHQILQFSHSYFLSHEVKYNPPPQSAFSITAHKQLKAHLHFICPRNTALDRLTNPCFNPKSLKVNSWALLLLEIKYRKKQNLIFLQLSPPEGSAVLPNSLFRGWQSLNSWAATVPLYSATQHSVMPCDTTTNFLLKLNIFN